MSITLERITEIAKNALLQELEASLERLDQIEAALLEHRAKIQQMMSEIDEKAVRA